jgi:hypothetical protein
VAVFRRLTAEKIKSSDLYVKLNGTGGVGYVTRDDLRKLTLSAANQLSATSIVEDPASFSQELFNNILAQSQTVTADDAFFDDQRTKATFHGDDLKPDVVTREINKIFTKETGKDEWHFNGSMSGNVNVIDLFGGGFTNTLSGSQLHEFLKEHNVESDIQGNKIIAKSIQLQQLNIADFVSKFNFVGEFRNISGSAKNNLKTVIFGEPVAPEAISGTTTFSAISAPCGNATALVVKQLVK